MDRSGAERVWRALSAVAIVAVCLAVAVLLGEVVLGPAIGPLLAPFGGAGLAAAVLAVTGRGRPGTPDDPGDPGYAGRSALLVATAPASLAALAQVLREGTGAEHAEVWLNVPGGLAAQSGPEWATSLTDLLLRPEVDHALPVVDDGELRAVLTLGKPGRPVTAADRTFVAEVGSGAGLLLRVVARGAELRSRVSRAGELARETEESRRRLGRAREVERRRLVSELGGATTDRLVALRTAITDAGEAIDEGLEEPEDELAREEARAEATELARHHLETARERLEELLERFRAIARGVHPAVLRDQGPRAALEEIIADLPRAVRLSGRLADRLPWEVESGLYYAAASALGLLGARSAEEPLELDLEQDGDRAEVRLIDAEADAEATRAALADDADRLAALGGSLEAHVDDAGRTVLRARLPIQLSPLVEAGAAR